jgi:hypothetical protein
MKHILIAAMLLAPATSAIAQTSNTDTVKTMTDTTRKTKKWIKFHLHNDKDDRSLSISDSSFNKAKRPKYPKFSFGLTFSRFDLGFATLIDKGSFTLAPQNQFLSYRQSKTSNVGFDVLQFGARFSDNFKIYLSGGFDWTLIRLRDNITILPGQPVLTYKTDDVDFSKNRFSSSYLRIPLSFDFRTKKDIHGNRFHFVFGPDGGFLLNGRVKQISDEYGKQKFDDTYHFATFRYGAFTRIGYGDFGIFAKYYFNDMFENSPEQAGIKNLSFGVTVGF